MVLGVGAGAAYAHDELVGTYPEDGQKVVMATRQVVLRFDEPVQSAAVTVRGEDGRAVSMGSAVLTGSEVRQRVNLSARGSYVVSWRVISDDGHPVTGEYTFMYANPAASKKMDATNASGATPASGNQATGGGVSPALWWILGVAGIVIAGLAAVVVRGRGGRQSG